MEPGTVKIGVRYRYDPGTDAPCKAMVIIELPSDHTGALAPELRSWWDVLADEPLVAQWGSGVGDHRESTVDLGATTWDQLVNTVEEFKIDMQILLTSVRWRNLEMIKWMPQDTEEVFRLEHLADKEGVD